MKDEIKEILDRLERIDHKEYIAFEFADSATFDEIARCFEERKKMADCITNLQEENKIRQQDINNLTYQLAKEKSRNEKAIEYIEDNTHYFSTDTKEIYFDIDTETDEEFCNTLENILKGSDNNE